MTELKDILDSLKSVENDDGTIDFLVNTAIRAISDAIVRENELQK